MPRQDSEPPMVAASRWVSEITNIALQLCLPVGAGFWADNRWKTSPWFVLVGAALGLLAAVNSFVQMVKRLTPPPKPPGSSSPEKPSDNSGPSQQ
jgi:F0F1-type ATP synthase assembly protein I